MKRILLVATVLVLAFSSASAAKKIKAISLEDGARDDNVLPTPVIRASAPLEIGDFDQGFPAGSPLMREKTGAIGGGMRLGPDLDLGPLLTKALRSQAPQMGFDLGTGGWKLSGTLRAMYYDLRSNGWVVFMYSTVVVDLEIETPDGDTKHDTLQIYNYDSTLKSFKRELAELLVDGAQEILARTNVRYFGFPPDPSIEALVEEIRAKPSNRHLEYRMFGLSGSREIVSPLLEIMASHKDESDRAQIANAFALIADPQVIPALAERFPEEDEDVRWYTLKAMAYIGSDEARAVAEKNGSSDDSKACLALSRDLLDPSVLAQPAAK